MLIRPLTALYAFALFAIPTLVEAADGGSFTLTTVNIEGSLEEEGVRNALAAQLDKLRGCTAPGDAPPFSQPIDVKVQIVGGKVKRFATEADNGADAGRMRCVERELRKFRFPRAGGKAVVKLTLTPAAGGTSSSTESSAAPAAPSSTPAPRATQAKAASAPSDAVRVEVLSTAGPIAAPSARNALQDRAGAIASCANQQRRAVSGELGLKLRINTAGRIDKHAVKHDGIGNRRLAGCVMNAVRGTLFEPMSAGETIVEVKLLLQSSGAAQPEGPAEDVSNLPPAPQREDVLHTILGMRPRIAACAANASGRVAIKAVIHGPKGAVQSVRMRTRFPRSVQQCIRKVVGNEMQLPPFQKRSFEVLFAYDL